MSCTPAQCRARTAPIVARFCPGPQLVFTATVKADGAAVPRKRGVVPSIDPEVRRLFQPFVSELRSKLQL